MALSIEQATSSGEYAFLLAYCATNNECIMNKIHFFANNIFITFLHRRGHNEAVTLRAAIGKYTCSIYALESMLYLTTGIMDKYDNSNVNLETAIFKVSCTYLR